MILIRKGTIHNGLGQVLKQTDLLIDHGQIIRIGKDLTAKEATVIEAEGKCVMPGFIDPMSSWGTSAGRGQKADNEENSDPLTPQLDSMDAFDPQSMMYQQLWEYGITAAAVLPGDKNILGGTGSVWKSWGRDPKTMCVAEKAVMRGSAKAAVKKTYGSRNIAPMTRMGLFSALRQMVAQCESKEEKEARDPKVLAMKPVLAGELPLLMSCDKAMDVRNVERALGEHPVRLIVADCYELEGLPSGLQHGLILGDLTDGFNERNLRLDYGQLFERIRQGQPVALSAFGDNSSPGREILLWNAHGLLRQARRLKAGIDAEQVLQMMTSIPARLLQVSDRIGALREGMDADVVIWSDHPLMTFDAHPETVIISGERVKGGEAR